MNIKHFLSDLWDLLVREVEVTARTDSDYRTVKEIESVVLHDWQNGTHDGWPIFDVVYGNNHLVVVYDSRIDLLTVREIEFDHQASLTYNITVDDNDVHTALKNAVYAAKKRAECAEKC